MIDQNPTFRRTLSPAQLAMFIIVGLLVVGVEILILHAYFGNLDTAAKFEDVSFLTTNLANIQREALRLHIETDRVIFQGEGDIDTIELRRSLLGNQLRFQDSRASKDPRFINSLTNIQATLREYDGLVAGWSSSQSNGNSFDTEEIRDVLTRLELQVKNLYDIEERSFFHATSTALKAQSSSQILLLVGSGLILVLIIVLGLSISGTVHNLRTEMDRRRRVELELEKARDEALGASRAKSEFLASMSHEIRTPMNAIIGVGDLLSETPLAPEQRQYVEIFQNEGSNLLDIINDILDLSKIEAGQLALENSNFDLAELIEDLLPAVSIKAATKGLNLNCRIKPGTITSVIGDSVRLRQIISNLLSNAIKFTHRGYVTLVLEQDYEMDAAVGLRFQVSDTGIGIPLDKQAAIFNSFTQADSSTTRRYGGTGLGLSIANQLVHHMEGSLWLESAQGLGTTFYFTVKLQLQEGTRQIGSEGSDCLKDQKIMVVDPNSISRQILEEMIASWGARVFKAEGTAEALDELSCASEQGVLYDLVLVDASFSDVSGFGFVETGNLHDQIPQIVLEPDYRYEKKKRLPESKISYYLMKPVKRLELLGTIQQALGLRPAESNEQELTKEPAQIKIQRPLSILIVEDSKTNQLMFQAYVNKTNYRLDIAVDGAEGVQKFKAMSYDLVFMDLQMPVMDGYAATEAIRDWERAQGVEETPVIALTANAMKEDVERSAAVGCNAHLTKPIKMGALLDAIEKYSREVVA